LQEKKKQKKSARTGKMRMAANKKKRNTHTHTHTHTWAYMLRGKEGGTENVAGEDVLEEGVFPLQVGKEEVRQAVRKLATLSNNNESIRNGQIQLKVSYVQNFFSFC
jgi:hypothetical protein